jgi:DNA-directed RNA polymerase sigma subunit (sigma70/sigma32)
VSLDAKARTQNEDGSSILDLIAAENEKPEDDLILTTKVQAVQQALSYMCENSKTILSMRYGLDGEEPCSKREIARRIGIAQDTTARLLANAERQLRLILKEGPPGKYQPQKHSSSLIWGWG